MLNNCNFIGRLGNDPETAFTPNGSQVTKISIACGEKWKDKNTGQMQEHTEWVRGSAFGKLAEIMAQYLKKGSLVYISGKIRTNKYTDKNGVEKYSTEIIINEMKMLDSRGDNPQASAPQSSNQPQVTQVDNGMDNFDQDVPF